MTDAADPIETLMALRDHLDSLMVDAEALAQKQVRERAVLDAKIAAANKDVALASALAALRAGVSDCKHERVRVQMNGARQQIQKALAG